MKVYAVLLALVALAQSLDPRGARPVVPNTRSEKCSPQKEWPYCADDDWGPKCPSGCRIQGLMEKSDHGFQKRIEKVRGLLEQNQGKHRSAEVVSTQTHTYLREKLTLDSGNDNNYYDMAQNLRQRIVNMKIKIDQQLQVLAALKGQVKNQVDEMLKLEVDIDMKLRTCKGSCKTHHAYQVEPEGHVALEKQLNQLDMLSSQKFETVGTLQVMKSRPLKDAVVSNSRFKSGNVPAAQQTTDDMFPEVKTVQLFLEVEGSSSSPATISKVPGTSLSPSSSGTSSSTSFSSTSSKSITELRGDSSDPFTFGGAFESLGQPSVSTKSVSCTKRVRTVVVDSGDGPVQKIEEYYEGGPECQQSFSKGGMTSLFPSLASSSGGTKTVHFTSSAKGSLGDSKTTFMDPFGGDAGLDLGAFMTDNTEDDLPDVQARSVKSARVERQADYEGKVCLRLNQNGRPPLSHSGPKQRLCGGKSTLPMCTDDQWVSRCPSGCKIQGLILENEKSMEIKLKNICKMVKTYEDAAEKTMATTARIYHENRESITDASLLQVKFVEGAEDLQKNLTSLRKRSKNLEQEMKELRGKVQQQLEELQRTEVEVDLRLRSCLGSCHSAPEFPLSLEDYDTLHSAAEKPYQPTLKSKTVRAGNTPQIRTAPVDFGPEPSPIYKVIRRVLTEGLDLFEDLRLDRIVLEEKPWSELD